MLKSVIFWATFKDIWRFFSGHTATKLPTYVNLPLDIDNILNCFQKSKMPAKKK